VLDRDTRGGLLEVDDAVVAGRRVPQPVAGGVVAVPVGERQVLGDADELGGHLAYEVAFGRGEPVADPVQAHGGFVGLVGDGSHDVRPAGGGDGGWGVVPAAKEPP